MAEGQYTHAGLAAIFQPFVEERLLPLLRRSPLGSLPGVDPQWLDTENICVSSYTISVRGGLT